MASYTVERVYELPWITDSDAHKMIALVTRDGTDEHFEVRWSAFDFDLQTDAQRRSKIQAACDWHVQHHVTGTLVPPEPAPTRTDAANALVGASFTSM